MGRPKGIENKVLHIWTNEEKERLSEIAPGHHYKEIQEIMNKKYNLDFTLNQIKGAISRYKFNTGLNGQFEKNHVPFNKDKKGTCAKGSEKGWFLKGVIPPNHRPVGSERITVDDYTEVKVAEPNKWRLKHQLSWEQHNGTIPLGYAVIFGDGNRQNTDIDNLILVSRQQLLVLNRYKLIQSNADSTRTGVIIADIYQKISDRKNKLKGPERR